ncbi:MAG TPA: hypothetical protein VND90_14390 [Terracidiphilus sp.]|nr:hypothetical protein [Terracidiphilus sp.]
MKGDRGAIWLLLAMGRITATEAERLLAACREGRETAWIVAGYVAVTALVELHGVRSAPESVQTLTGAVKTVMHWMGGWR